MPGGWLTQPTNQQTQPRNPLPKGNFQRHIKGDVHAEVVSGLAGISKKIDITGAVTRSAVHEGEPSS
jgi:hypothetical protein